MENEPKEMPDLSVSADVAADPALESARLDDAAPAPGEKLETPSAVVNEAVAAEPVKAVPPPKAPAKKKAEGESWLETVKTIFYALLIAVVIRTFLFQPFNIPSASMENTLLIGDYLFVEKFAYGYSRYTFPFGGWPFGDALFRNRFAVQEDLTVDHLHAVAGEADHALDEILVVVRRCRVRHLEDDDVAACRVGTEQTAMEEIADRPAAERERVAAVAIGEFLDE